MRAPVKPEGWRCPQCGRRFRQRARGHSCDLRPLEVHLDRASAGTKQTVTAIRDALAAIGPHGFVPVKTMILFRAGANFGSMIVRRDVVDLEFVLPRALHDSRIRRSERLGPRRYSHRTRLASPGEVDDQLVGWLREAYRFVSEAHGA